jgi:HK97 family phage prohead protease
MRMPEIKREVRAFTTASMRALESEDGSFRFEGTAIKYESWSEKMWGFRERVARGACTKTLAEDDIRCLHNHDVRYVLGRNKAGTLVLTEDEEGLHFTVNAPDAQWARDLHASVKRGDVNQCSFMFDKIRDAWSYDSANDIEERTLLEIKLYEVSIVTFPAYPETEASARSVFSAHKEETPAKRSSVTANLRKRLDLYEKE